MGVVRYTTVNGQIMGESRAGSYKTYVPDGLGSTVALKDSTGALTDTFRYWPNGEERARTGTTATPFRFGGTGGYYHESVGSQYVRARHLAPAMARWRQPDPIVHPLIGPSFVYADCDPLRALDGSGLLPKMSPGERRWFQLMALLICATTGTLCDLPNVPSIDDDPDLDDETKRLIRWLRKQRECKKPRPSPPPRSIGRPRPGFKGPARGRPGGYRYPGGDPRIGGIIIIIEGGVSIGIAGGGVVGRYRRQLEEAMRETD